MRIITDIQPLVISILRACAPIAGIPILADDGSYPKTPQREEALRTGGLLIIAWAPQSGGITSQAKDGTTVQDINIPIVIEENIAVNRVTGGIGIDALLVVQYVLAALSGAPRTAMNTTNRFQARPGDPYVDFGKIEGINKFLVNMTTQLTISPI